MEQYFDIIKDVAIYIRKSRAKGIEETDETLEKHREILVNFAKKNKFRYVIYSEVVSADSISNRPQMIKLLDDIKEDLYDAVLVVDIDRLTRGDEEDSGRIKRIFVNAGIFIITPDKIYNLENEDDETYLDFKTFMSRQEYKMINRRLLRGKKQGSRMGYWTNGIPPLPYLYNPEIKGLIIDEEKLSIYKLMKDKFLNEHLPPQKIAWYLNSLNIPSPRNKFWSANVIQRILVDETHLGRIISNKTKGNSRKGQKIIYYPREQWIIRENCHEAVKTTEEHEMIIKILSKRKPKTSKKSRPKCITSGLIRCGYCNSVMQIHDSSYKKYKVLNCARYNHIGEKCQSKGIREDILIEYIWEYVSKYISEEFKETDEKHEVENLKNEIIKYENNKNKLSQKMKTIYQMFEDGDYTKDEFIQRREERQNELNKIDNMINELQKQVNSYEKNNKSEHTKLCKELKKKWRDNMTSEEKNQLLHLTFDMVEYFRSQENPDDIRVKLWFK